MAARDKFRSSPGRVAMPANMVEADFGNAMSLGHAYGVLVQYGLRVFLSHLQEVRVHCLLSFLFDAC